MDPVKPAASTSGELILALQNRINDLEVKLQASDKERSSKAWVDLPFLESRSAELKAEIAELRAEIKSIARVGKALDQEDKDAQKDKGGLWNEFISIFE